MFGSTPVVGYKNKRLFLKKKQPLRFFLKFFGLVSRLFVARDVYQLDVEYQVGVGLD